MLAGQRERACVCSFKSLNSEAVVDILFLEKKSMNYAQCIKISFPMHEKKLN